MKNAQMFEQYLLVKRGFQPITVAGYVGGIKRITRVVGEYPTHEAIERYFYNFYMSNYSYSHKKNTGLAVEHYMRFIGRPIKLARQKRPQQMIKDTLTEAEITKLIFSCKNIKERAIISLLAYSGIRNKELCNLRVEDFDAGRNTVRILQGKGLKDGVSQIAPECTKILLEYINLYQKQTGNYIFNTYQGNKYTGWALRKRVKVIAERAETKKRVYPHLFRHSLAVNMLIRGANVVTLKKQLRHTLLETTLHYLNSIILGEKNDYEKSVPSYI